MQKTSQKLDHWMWALFEACREAVFIHEYAGTILAANPAACRTLGYLREELLRIPINAICDCSLAADSLGINAELTTKKPISKQGRLRAKDGRIVEAEISNQVVDYENRAAFLTVARLNLPGKSSAEGLRLEAEKALRESEAFYHALVESLPQNIYRKDAHGRITFANQHLCKTLNKSLEEVLGKTDFELFPAHLAHKYVEDDRKVIESGKTFETVEEHHLPDGRKLYVQVVKMPVWDINGHAIGTQGIFWDVTERKRADEALVASEQRYRQLTEAAHDGIVVAGQDGLIALFNPAAERLFGYSADEAIGQSLEILIPEQFKHLHRAGFRRYMTTRQSRIIGRPVEVEGRRKDGSTMPLEVALSVVEIGGREGGQFQFLGILRDLTERNRVQALLVQNEKLASIGLLSAGVAHEINNPLTFVANNLVVLEREGKNLVELLIFCYELEPLLAQTAPAEAARLKELSQSLDLAYARENLGRLLARSRDGVDRVKRIVRSLSSLARTDDATREESDLRVVLEASLDIMRGQLKQHNVELITEYDENSMVQCVQNQISQVFLNLLVNAQQAIEAAGKALGGRIEVRTKRLVNEMLIEVTDNGTGIDPAQMPKLFDPFFTTKEVGAGTGLGLSIVHNFIQGHGGRIEVESQLGRGSTFRVFVPTA